MIDHFEKLARSQDRSLRAKRIAALINVFLGVAMITAASAMALAFILEITN
jgi:hypothetical protein